MPTWGINCDSADTTLLSLVNELLELPQSVSDLWEIFLHKLRVLLVEMLLHSLRAHAPLPARTMCAALHK